MRNPDDFSIIFACKYFIKGKDRYTHQKPHNLRNGYDESVRVDKYGTRSGSNYYKRIE